MAHVIARRARDCAWLASPACLARSARFLLDLPDLGAYFSLLSLDALLLAFPVNIAVSAQRKEERQRIRRRSVGRGYGWAAVCLVG